MSKALGVAPLLLTLTALAGAVAAAGQAALPHPAGLAPRLDALSQLAGGPVEATVSPRTGLVTFLSTTPGRPIPARGESAEARARSFLADQGELFGLGPEPELLTRRVSPVDRVGMEHVRFRQTYHGVPVAGGEVGVHLRGEAVIAAHARLLSAAALARVSTVPVIQAGEVPSRVLAVLERTGVDTSDLELSTPRLEILDRGHLGGPELPARLAWFVEARRVDLREYLWIDARTGTATLRFSQLTEAKDREIHDADDPGDGVYDDLPGVLIRSEGDPATGDSDADDAYDFAGDTYDYYLSEHGRDSYDDAGSTLISTVHFCRTSGACPYQNAFWNGEQMVYGEGFSAADDADAHELTHAVTEHTAELFYYMQSGALNESFSDIFGETVDLTNGAGTDTAGVRWLIGEDIPGFGALRDMADPTTVFGDPGKLSDAELVCATPGTDSGGVHSNSGVPNHSYALMVDGGTYNSVTVSGIGLTKAAKIEYRALTLYLLSSSSFADDDAALRQSCSDLVGTDGITVADCTEVGDALDAVEMSDPWPCGAPAAAQACDAGSPIDLFYDNFEELAGAGVNDPALLSSWTDHVISGGSHWGFCCLGTFATSGTGNLWGYAVNAARDSALEMTVDVSIPADAFIHFRHSYGMEESTTQNYDGGVVEYSTNGGSSWTDAGSLIDAGASYGGTIATGQGNPLGGRSAFVGDSFGYTASRLDLANFAGEELRFRFRMGTDSFPLTDDYGWFLDDFRIYTCGAGCGVPSLILTTGTVTGVDSETACDTITARDAYGVGATGDLTLTAPLVILADGFSVASGGKLSIGAP